MRFDGGDAHMSIGDAQLLVIWWSFAVVSIFSGLAAMSGRCACLTCSLRTMGAFSRERPFLFFPADMPYDRQRAAIEHHLRSPIPVPRVRGQA